LAHKSIDINVWVKLYCVMQTVGCYISVQIYTTLLFSVHILASENITKDGYYPFISCGDVYHLSDVI
jgi:hypothetical protein